MAKDKNSMGVFSFAQPSKPRAYINVGCLFDIPTGVFVIGKHGETITNGGLGPITAFCGKGNYFKSTIAHYFALCASDRCREADMSGVMMLYDTEINVNYERLNKLAGGFKHLPEDVATSPIWTVTSKENIPGDEWFEKLNIALKDKGNDKDLDVKFECFKDPITKKELIASEPVFVTIDSYSELEGSESVKKLDGNLEDKSTTTFAMVQGMFKTKLGSRLPVLSSASNTYFILTAQAGDHIDIGGPLYGPAPIKDLQHLQSDVHLKGVGSKFYFLTTQAWLVLSCKSLINQSTKEPEYPVDGNDVTRNELNILKLQVLRNKNGPSGDVIEIILSQSEGLLPSLTEFHFIKERGRFGLVGNNVSYSLVLRPDVKLGRTTVRSKLDNDPLLRRAVSITADLLQLKINKPEVIREGLWCEPEVLYEDIKKLGYDWDVLLNTRSYWLANQYDKKHLPFLSTMDLLKMRKGLYSPYFLKEKK